jgi:hypothetical protein
MSYGPLMPLENGASLSKRPLYTTATSSITAEKRRADLCY